MKTGVERAGAYKVISLVILVILAILFAFPLYWILTGALKTPAAINAPAPEWWPREFTLRNFQVLFTKRSAPLYELPIPFTKLKVVGPTVPAAIRWLLNTVFMAVMAMVLTCATAAMAGYALAKKRFRGRYLIFSLIVAAMALPKQVILIPLIREMSALGLYDNIWAVIYPTVGWPFGVFLMKQFSEVSTIAITAMNTVLSSQRIAAGTVGPTTLSFVNGIGALAIFTFINSWNDYFMQLIMLTSNTNLTISLGIATMQAENSTDYGLIMAGAALASVPIIVVFLMFQKYFTQGITMGAVKG